jgi:hypothetical protein
VKWREKSVPSAARRSRLGVVTLGCPSAERQVPRIWSAVMKSTFLMVVVMGAGLSSLSAPAVVGGPKPIAYP